MTAVNPTSRAPRTPFRRQPVLLFLLVLAVLVVLTAVAVVKADTLSDSTQQALLAALDDEREAQATYAKAAELYDAGPFAHVVEAERHHEAHLLDLFQVYGLDVPADAWAQRTVELPETAAAACAAAVQWETANAAMYDDFLSRDDLPADVRAVFQRLGSVSRQRHLPAFQRCADGQLGGGMGGRGGHGGGMHGRGMRDRGGMGAGLHGKGAGCPGMRQGDGSDGGAHARAGCGCAGCAGGHCAGPRASQGGGHCARHGGRTAPQGDCPHTAPTAEVPADTPDDGAASGREPSGGAPGVAPDCLQADAPTPATFCPLPAV